MYKTINVAGFRNLDGRRARTSLGAVQIWTWPVNEDSPLGKALKQHNKAQAEQARLKAQAIQGGKDREAAGNLYRRETTLENLLAKDKAGFQRSKYRAQAKHQLASCAYRSEIINKLAKRYHEWEGRLGELVAVSWELWQSGLLEREDRQASWIREFTLTYSHLADIIGACPEEHLPDEETQAEFKGALQCLFPAEVPEDEPKPELPELPCPPSKPS